MPSRKLAKLAFPAGRKGGCSPSSSNLVKQALWSSRCGKASDLRYFLSTDSQLGAIIAPLRLHHYINHEVSFTGSNVSEA